MNIGHFWLSDNNLFQLDELNDSYDKELKLALQQAEDYTVKYEEVSSNDQTVRLIDRPVISESNNILDYSKNKDFGSSAH